MRRPNIVFILTDQERHFSVWPDGFEMAGRQAPRESGVTFTNHTIASNVLEPFDVHTDPHESDNLADDIEASSPRIEEMNGLMTRLIQDEVGADDRAFLPDPPKTPWHVERWDL